MEVFRRTKRTLLESFVDGFITDTFTPSPLAHVIDVGLMLSEWSEIYGTLTEGDGVMVSFFIAKLGGVRMAVSSSDTRTRPFHFNV